MAKPFWDVTQIACHLEWRWMCVCVALKWHHFLQPQMIGRILAYSNYENVLKLSWKRTFKITERRHNWFPARTFRLNIWNYHNLYCSCYNYETLCWSQLDSPMWIAQSSPFLSQPWLLEMILAESTYSIDTCYRVVLIKEQNKYMFRFQLKAISLSEIESLRLAISFAGCVSLWFACHQTSHSTLFSAILCV